MEHENGVSRYLIQHDPKAGAFVRILKSAHPDENVQETNKDFYNVHLAYSMVRSNEDAAPPPASAQWLPIDVDIITQYHRETQKVPGLFAPKRYRGSNDDKRTTGKPKQKFYGRNKGRRNKQCQK